MRGNEAHLYFNNNVVIKPTLLSGVAEGPLHATAASFPMHLFYISVIVALALALVITITRIISLVKEKKYKQIHENKLNDALSKAELDMLKSQLDPHFVYNSLSCLTQVIKEDQQKAIAFNEKLAKTCRYFLINKRRNYVSLSDEIAFIKDYFSLLQVRHDKAIQLHLNIEEHQFANVLILPGALQLLIENAVKHNSFSEAEPLHISVQMTNNFISVCNDRNTSKIVSYSTRKGLANLKKRYQLLCNEMITVEKNTSSFIVKLPLIKSA